MTKELHLRIPNEIDNYLMETKKRTNKSKNVQIVIALEEKITREQAAEATKPKRRGKR